MSRSKIDYTEHFAAVMKMLRGPGLLVGSYDAAGRANAMTIGWGSIGSVWGIPMWTILVRPSRYTYRCIEHSGCFTVNVPAAGMEKACAICGSKSGRDMDKFKECGLTTQKALTVLAPTIDQCPIVYECQVVHSNDVLPAKLSDEILQGAYISGDFHRIYFGKILATQADPNAGELLKL
jgi:flavin reductase (DIM6/NTAB) family NADH-FMN oxidoreductase RutF